MGNRPKSIDFSNLLSYSSQLGILPL